MFSFQNCINHFIFNDLLREDFKKCFFFFKFRPTLLLMCYSPFYLSLFIYLFRRILHIHCLLTHSCFTFTSKVRGWIPISKLLFSALVSVVATQMTLISSGINILSALTRPKKVYSLMPWAAHQTKKTWTCKLFLLTYFQIFLQIFITVIRRVLFLLFTLSIHPFYLGTNDS